MSVLSDDEMIDVDFIDSECDDEARAPRGLFTVDPPAVCYLGRFSIKRDRNEKVDRINTRIIAKKYIERWVDTNKKYIFTYEISDQGIPHCHFICFQKDKYKSSTMSDFWKQYVKMLRSEAATWHQEGKTDLDIKKYLLYSIKDNDIICTNLTDEELEEIKKENNKIKEDMGRSPLEKLLYRCAGGKYNHMRDLALDIINIYVDEYNKAPPMAQLKGWTIYIWIKIGMPWDELEFVIDKIF